MVSSLTGIRGNFKGTYALVADILSWNHHAIIIHNNLSQVSLIKLYIKYHNFFHVLFLSSVVCTL